jgi:hypothetical protein
MRNMILPSQMPKKEPDFTESRKGVVIEEFEEMNLRLFGAIANGNAVIVGSQKKGLKFTRGQDFKLKNGKTAYMVKIQVIEPGIGKEIASQTWNRTKTQIVKKEVYKKPTPKQETIKVDTEVKCEDLF